MGKLDQILFFAMLCLKLQCLVNACPDRCTCTETTVRCMFLDLDRIPSNIPSSTKILDLRFNKINDIPPGSLSNLTDLTSILFNNNAIQRLKTRAFDGLKNLKHLYLYRNQIQYIDSEAFHGLHNLEHLYLHFNQLEDLSPNTFKKLNILERLFLNNNQIRRLPKGIFNDLDNLKRLRLDQNGLICDCQMIWLSSMLKEREGIIDVPVLCNTPGHKPKEIIKMEPSEFQCIKPTITKQPDDVTLQFGNTAYFTCQAEGDPIPDIIWLHNNVELDLSDQSRMSLLDDGTLMIQRTQITDKGLYICVAQNTAGESKASPVFLEYSDEPATAELNVFSPADDIILEQGEVLSLQCSIPGSDISWTRDNHQLNSNDQRIQLLSQGLLTITNIQPSDQGNYQCQTENDHGQFSSVITVTVHVPARIVEEPQDQEISSGRTVLLICIAQGYPVPQLTWTREGRQLSPDSRYIISIDSTRFEIRDSRPEDSGSYECTAVNEAGRAHSSARVNVISRGTQNTVSSNSSPQDFRVPVHGTVELFCNARGDANPRITWYRNSSPVVPNRRTFIGDEGDLFIYNITFLDEGLYECVAHSSFGTARSYARVIVLELLEAYVGDPFVDQSVRDAVLAVNRAFNNTLRDLHNPHNPKTPTQLLQLFRLPSTHQALEITRSAEIYERALEIVLDHVTEAQSEQMSFNLSNTVPSFHQVISPSHLAMIANLSNCAAYRRHVDCTNMCFHSKYRTADGSCNNLQHPMWGSSLTPLKRLKAPIYENGFNMPVGWSIGKRYNGYLIPSARLVSLEIGSANHVTPDENFTHMLMQWGQFIDHDLDFTPQAVSQSRFSDGRYCNETCDNQAPCFPIQVPPNDPRITRRRCMGVTRSSSMCGSGTTSVFYSSVSSRQQINQITHYIDASNVYGSSEEEQRRLRDFTSNRGYLRVGILTSAGKDLLPPNVDAPIDCQMDPSTAHVPCFMAGDVRNNEQLGLLSMHTIWMREHNRIADQLRTLNPQWDSDTIFHESRKIVGAMLQHITYKHWLPKVLGDAGMKKIGDYKGYNPSVDASISNVFATSAFRFGHSLINPIIYRLNETFQPDRWGNLPLHKAFFAPFRLLEEGGIDPILRGLFGVAAKKLTPNELLNTELTEKLFKLAHEVALDLAALNIQRGRDHGLPFYNEYRKFCGLSAAQTFEDLGAEISNREVLRKIQQLYGHPDNIDIWVGGLVEDVLPGSRIGPTFNCLIANQFRRTRDGDRFWYENPGVFTPAQLTQIKQTSLARIICDNSDAIEYVQMDLFLRADYPQGYLRCNSEKIPTVDLKVWSECCQDCSSRGDFRTMTSQFSPRNRGKRQAEFSYPDQKPIHSEASSPPEEPSIRNISGSSTQDNEKKILEDDDKLHMTHSMMDVIDSRIEGVEDLLHHMEKSMHKLNKKIRRLEKQMHIGPNHLIQGDEPSPCIDFFGLEHKHGETWQEHDCKSCTCKRGQLECSTQTCQIPTCDHPRKIEGQCCPEC